MKNNIIKTVIIVFAVLALIILGVQYLEYRMQSEALVTTTSERKVVDFVDGSSVELAPRSTIKYANYFNKKGRFVELVKGSGSFTIVEEKGRFRIKTEREIITVLDSETLTVFDTNFGESQTTIKVKEGRVNVRQNATKQGQIDVKSMKIVAGETVISTKGNLEKILE
jgi:ferric-dicitrate binding protein FerR (iron transport regulator)